MHLGITLWGFDAGRDPARLPALAQQAERRIATLAP
jgi:hypothetical protein